MNRNRCRHCHTIFLPNPRVKNQRYCHRPECQRARKALWQKQKMHQDLDYQTTHRESQKNWMEQNQAIGKTIGLDIPPTYIKTVKSNKSGIGNGVWRILQRWTRSLKKYSLFQILPQIWLILQRRTQ